MFNLLALILFVAFSLVSCFVETSGLVYFGLLAGAVILAMLGQNKKRIHFV